jgi:hypothetical protein
MDWQLATVMVLVAAAGLYLVRRAWRTWRGAKGGCGGSCGCAAAAAERPGAALIPPEHLTLRRRPTRD